MVMFVGDVTFCFHIGNCDHVVVLLILLVISKQ